MEGTIDASYIMSRNEYTTCLQIHKLPRQEFCGSSCLAELGINDYLQHSKNIQLSSWTSLVSVQISSKINCLIFGDFFSLP